MSNVQLAVHFFFQIAVILAFCQVVGWLAKRAGQPQVVAEMLAGVLLGPSLLGLLWPGDAIEIARLELALYFRPHSIAPSREPPNPSLQRTRFARR